MTERDEQLVAMVKKVRAERPAPRDQLVESLAYGNLKFEEPSLQRSTMSAAARQIARE